MNGPVDLRPAPFLRYDEHGGVTDWGTMSSSVIGKLKADGERILIGGTGNSGDFYVDLADQSVHPKTESPAYLDGMTLRAVPVPSVLRIGLESYETDEADVELEFEFPGTYSVVLTSPQHLPKTFTVTA